MTFSVTKSYLSTVAGLALDSGLIRNLNDPVKGYVRVGKFDSLHNARITWHHHGGVVTRVVEALEPVSEPEE